MSAPSTDEITGLLRAWGGGDEEALGRLVPMVYAELHRRARHYMHGERPGHTLQTTALVNEVYLRLVNCDTVDWKDRAHFFAMCARLMRRILTDLARSRRYDKRGGKIQHVTLDIARILRSDLQPDLVELEDALQALQDIDPRKVAVVELRFFSGLSVKETAEVLKVSEETVMRDWRLAKVWLLRELSREKNDG
jgi:RNA polymerase sigma-70 factor, ECF subfamily